MSVYLKCKADGGKFSFKAESTANKPYLAMKYTTQTGTHSTQTTTSKAYCPLTTDTAAVSDKKVAIKVTENGSSKKYYVLGRPIQTITYTSWSMTSSNTYKQSTRIFTISSTYIYTSDRIGDTGSAESCATYSFDEIHSDERISYKIYMPISATIIPDLGVNSFTISSAFRMRTDSSPHPWCNTYIIASDGVNKYVTDYWAQGNTRTSIYSSRTIVSTTDQIDYKIHVNSQVTIEEINAYKYSIRFYSTYTLYSSASNATYSDSYTGTTTQFID